jgi:hypothetical protein
MSIPTDVSIFPILLVQIQLSKPSTVEKVLLCLFRDEHDAKTSLLRTPMFEESHLLRTPWLFAYLIGSYFDGCFSLGPAGEE